MRLLVIGTAQGARRRAPWIARTLALAGLIFLSAPAGAQEYEIDAAPAPESVADSPGPFGKGVRDRVRAATLFPRLKQLLQGLPPFVRDTELVWNTRSYYLNRRRSDDSRAEAWALGGALRYRSGWLAESLRIGADFYTSQRLLGKRSQDGTLLLKPEQEGYSVLGQLFAVARYRDHHFTAYRQTFDLPYVNSQDSRMSPNTFEGYRLRGAFKDLPGVGGIDYTAGFLTDMKRRSDDEFESFSQVAGVEGDVDHGLALAGILVRPRPGLRFGAVDYFVKDTLNIAYVESDLLIEPAAGWEIGIGAQFTHQRSVGDDALTGSSFETWVASGRLAIGYGSAILEFGVASTDHKGTIRSPFGSYPGFVSLMQRDFNRAGEDAWRVSLSNDFGRLGVEGLSAKLVYAEGYGARDAPDQREFNATLDYKAKQGLLRGLWLRFRVSVLDRQGVGRNSHELRVVFNHELPAL